MYVRISVGSGIGIALASALLLSGCATPPLTAADRCAGLCASHDDGYFWAQRRSLLEKRLCYGYSGPFTRGCLDEIEDYREGHAYIDDKNHETEE